MAEARAFARGRTGSAAHVLGRQPHAQVLDLIKGARFLVLPSECYETFPLVLVEAFACGVPVIASRLGGMAEILQDGHTGLHFAPGDPADLADKADWLWSRPDAARKMGRAARATYEAKYTANANYPILMRIYEAALSGS
jgi:glycosyltransferase involved in cell wall biosynthesis